MGGGMDGGLDVVSCGHILFRGTGCGYARLGWGWTEKQREQKNGELREERKGEQIEKGIHKEHRKILNLEFNAFVTAYMVHYPEKCSNILDST